jgi:hypothetical protein
MGVHQLFIDLKKACDSVREVLYILTEFSIPMKLVRLIKILHHRVQNGSEVHPASYPMGTKDTFAGGKAAGARS